MAASVDLSSRDSIAAALRATILAFGGVDIVINTAAIYPTPDPATTEHGISLDENAAHQRHRQLRAGGRSGPGAEGAEPAGGMVFTSSANAIVPKSGSEAYDVSKAAVNHLIRELAIGLGPLVRVNGIAPATVLPARRCSRAIA